VVNLCVVGFVLHVIVVFPRLFHFVHVSLPQLTTVHAPNKLPCTIKVQIVLIHGQLAKNMSLLNLSVEDLLDHYINDPHRTDCLNFIIKNRRLFNTSKGSAVKHQAWPGGYRDHITEVMRIAVVLYEGSERIRPLPFTLSDALFCCFLHDVEKIWKHVLNEKDKAVIDKDVLLGEQFQLNDDHWNAIKYAHGEGGDYHPIERVQGPLAAFVHHCDNHSARIWHDMPEPEYRSY